MPASHDELCFPERLHGAHGIKGVNQLLRCLGSTWAGLRKRQKGPRADFPWRAANLPPTQLLSGPICGHISGVKGARVVRLLPQCSPFKGEAALRKGGRVLSGGIIHPGLEGDPSYIQVAPLLFPASVSCHQLLLQPSPPCLLPLAPLGTSHL